MAISCVLLSYFGLAAAEIAFHWYAGTQDTPPARSLKHWYYFKDPRNGKANHQGCTDLIIPSILFGLAAGAITARRPPMQLARLILFLPIGVVALIPIYEEFLPDDWWLPMDGIDKILVLGVGYGKSLVIGAFFACIGRNLSRYFQHLTPDAD